MIPQISYINLSYDTSHSRANIHVLLLFDFSVVNLRRGASVFGSNLTRAVGFSVLPGGFANFARFNSGRVGDSPASCAPRFRFVWTILAERFFPGLILRGVVSGLGESVI